MSLISMAQKRKREHPTMSSSDVTLKRYPCPEKGCTYSNIRRADLNKHIKGFHQKIKDHACSHKDCKYSASRAYQVKRHILRRHQEPGFGCHFEKCEMKFG